MLSSDEEPAPTKWQEPACSSVSEQHLKGDFVKQIISAEGAQHNRKVKNI